MFETMTVMASSPRLSDPSREAGVRYRRYIACLNERAWDELATHVDEGVVYNGDRVGLAGYRDLLQRDVSEIPDLRFSVGLLVVQAPFVAARLEFDCSPRGRFLGLTVNGRRVTFAENVFYQYSGSRIIQVWSVIDKGAVERQLLDHDSREPDA